MVKPLPNSRRLLRLKCAAEYLSVGTRTMRTLVQRGEVPVVITREGAPWLVDVKDLDAWIESVKTTL